MATDGHQAPASIAPGFESAAFVRLVTRADGDALAASGLLARSLADRGTPFQVTVGRTIESRTDRATAATGDEYTLAIGTVDADVPTLGTDDRPATLAALEVLTEASADPDPVLALAGLDAAGVSPGAGETEWLLETATDRGLIEQRAGVAVPTDDPVADLSHSTRLVAPWSGGDVSESLPEIDATEDDRRALASLVALAVVGDETASEDAGHALERVCKPYATPEHAFATVGGFADVLTATARLEPGLGTALALGHDVHAEALETWRTHGERAHAALAGSDSSRYDGLATYAIDDGPVETVASLALAYRSPEPTVCCVGDDAAAIASREELSPATVESIARDLTCEYDIAGRRGYLALEADTDARTVLETVRAAL